MYREKSGFVQSLEFLKKFLKCAQQFFRPGKSLENRDEVLKNGKTSWGVFFFESSSRCFLSEIFLFGQILFNLTCTFAASHEKSFVPAFL